MIYSLAVVFVFFERVFRPDEPIEQQMLVFAGKMSGLVVLGAVLEAALMVCLSPGVMQLVLLVVLLALLSLILCLLVNAYWVWKQIVKGDTSWYER